MIPLARNAHRLLFGGGLALSLLFSSAPSPSAAQGNAFALRSKTFANGSILPQSMIINAQSVLGTPQPVPGCEGGNQSPELEWINAPRETRSFVIMMFDADASFTHWSIYNIPAALRSLPQNAGKPKSPYGPQVFNDFGLRSYDGPCPPSTFRHHYVFTIYAIDGVVALNAPPQLTTLGLNVPTGETLFDTLLEGRCHILASASIFGLYGLPPGATQNAAVRRRSP